MNNIIVLTHDWGIYIFIAVEISYFWILNEKIKKKVLKFVFPILVSIFGVIILTYGWIKIFITEKSKEPLIEIVLLVVVFLLHQQLKSYKSQTPAP